MITACKVWLGLVVIVTSAYAVRHFLFAFVRLYFRQRHSYQDSAGVYLPSVCLMVPMHNEQEVVRDTVNALRRIDYPRDRLLILIVNDRSTDDTRALLDEYCAGIPFIRVFHREDCPGVVGGKPAALNDARRLTDAEVILTFDADYWPSRDSVMRLAAPLLDPRVALTMGRVVPRNPDRSLLTRMLDLERAGGYQVNQQARHTLGLLPQYGGTVGAIRRSFLDALGGWHNHYLAEDTYLTVQAHIHGLQVVYVNLEETTEEVPDTWPVRQKQLRRWVIGHNQVAWRLGRMIWQSPFIGFWAKVDAYLLLSTYGATVLLVSGYVVATLLLLLGDGLLAGSSMAILILTTYSTLGNAAAFSEIAVAALLDERPRSLMGLAAMTLHFAGSAYVITAATVDWFWLEFVQKRQVEWQKTARARRGEVL